MPKPALALAATLLLGGAALAQEAGGEDPMKAIQEAAVKVSKALKESEDALTRVARGETASPQGADIRLPPPDGAKKAPPPPPPEGGGT